MRVVAKAEGPSRVGSVELGFDRRDQSGVVGGAEELLGLGHHCEGSAPARAVAILGHEMEVQVRELVGVGAVIDFGGVECGLHGFGGAGDVVHEEITLGVGQLEELIDVMAVGDDATATVGLLFEQVQRGDLHRSDLDHEVVEALVFAAVLAVGEFAHG